MPCLVFKQIAGTDLKPLPAGVKDAFTYRCGSITLGIMPIMLSGMPSHKFVSMVSF
ncbi:hypothetical protein AEST_25300 [Alishewanella aestuarii B11]|uniref:Uncharacterized protein n=1 Tax=Alishewanella aestuarii B11 TaxID=1197174 RepID=J2IBV4_9ALTE|nr:hypothetical protein AEST_25300 [Alishewanella aestuarii B11]